MVSVLFVLSAYTILSGNKAQMELLGELNLSSYATALGITNLVIVLSLWIKKTRYIGVFIGTAYLGGAIASELSIGDSGLVPALTMLLIWLIQKIDYSYSKKVSLNSTETSLE